LNLGIRKPGFRSHLTFISCVTLGGKVLLVFFRLIFLTCKKDIIVTAIINLQCLMLIKYIFIFKGPIQVTLAQWSILWFLQLDYISLPLYLYSSLHLYNILLSESNKPYIPLDYKLSMEIYYSFVFSALSMCSIDISVAINRICAMVLYKMWIAYKCKMLLLISTWHLPLSCLYSLIMPPCV
jgi:hypothetical protein